MNVMVLGAGRGTRLGELGHEMPKILMDIVGAPLLARQLDYLQGQGAQRVVVNAFHLSDQVCEFAAGYRGPLDLRVSVEPELLGTAGGVLYALDELGPEPFVVLYGDVMTDASLASLVAAHENSGAAATLAVYESCKVADKGLVVTSARGYVERFVEKDPAAVGPALINAGVYVLDPNPLWKWPGEAAFDFGFDYFPWLLGCGLPIHTFHLERAVIDIGTPTSLAEGRHRFAEGTDPS